MKIKDFYFSIILISSIVLGLIFANQFILLEPFTTPFLMIILFLAALKLNPKEVVTSIDETREQKIVLIATIFMLIILPIITYFIAYLIYSDLAPAFFILSLAPTGVTTPFLIDLMKGNKGLALIITIFTSLLSPFTIPFLIYFILGDVVAVDFVEMFLILTKIIIIPFVLAWTIRYFISNKIDQISSKFNDISSLILGFLFAGISAVNSELIIKTLLNWDGIFYLIALSLFFIYSYGISYIFFYRVREKERFTIIFCSVFMNFVLMIVLSNQFLYEYEKITIPLILSIIPWTISLIILKQFREMKKDKIIKKSILKFKKDIINRIKSYTHR